MKVIIEGLIKDFLKTFGMEDYKFSDNETEDFSKKLEYLVNYIFLSLNSDDRITWEVLENIDVGNTESIDGIMLVINGKLVENATILEELSQFYDKFNVKILSTQIKSSEKVEKMKINHFLVGVDKILNLDEPLTNENHEIKNFRETLSVLFKEYIGKIRNIEIKTLFASLNNLREIEKSKLEAEIKKYFLERMREIGDFDFKIWGINDIKMFYEKIYKNIEVTIRVENDLLPFPEMNDIDDAYIGFISYKEFLKIIEDENGNFRGSILFHDNPRDFLGYNEVNSEIKQTLESDRYKNFPVLNNGLTIVAEELNYKKRNLYLRNFQIVNGCQTTYILYDFKNQKKMENVYIPVKFISTKNDKIKNEIIKATNNQTRIGKEELTALSDFQKLLEDFYNYMNQKSEEKLYYERRKNQYIFQNIPKNRIIDMKTQAKVFASMFLKLPHEAAGYYGKITKKFGKDIFNINHRPYPYYLSSFMFFKLMQFFNRKKIDKGFRKSKFHILMLMPLIIKKEIPSIEKKEIDNYCEEILNLIMDDKNFLKLVNACIEVIKESDIDYSNLKELYRVETVRKLLDNVKQ